jgi:hypothetical protein
MRVLDWLLGCRHKKNISFPISRRIAGRVKPPYIVCLECGREIPYDWQRMRPVPTSRTRPVVKQQPIEARLENLSS